ncbi:MAG: hypothetical protein FJ137_00045 [Deltaproteobacteria bacterium]|nr:hypothetical protein [Deltaproteobacteria bacterium]
MAPPPEPLPAFQPASQTAAEQRVLRALDDRLRPAGAAARLGLAIGTVRVHLKRVYAETGAHGQRRVVDRFARIRASLLPHGPSCARSG